MTGWMSIVVDDKIARQEATFKLWTGILVDALAEQRRIRDRFLRAGVDALVEQRRVWAKR